jgi:4-carboxymuconolactone decarboxylase
VTARIPPAASPTLLPLNEQVEKQRADTVEKNVGPISPGLVKFTADPLFLDLWQRPALTPRDRSLVTVSALIAAGQSAQIGYHLNRAMDNGLSAEEAGEVVARRRSTRDGQMRLPLPRWSVRYCDRASKTE